MILAFVAAALIFVAVVSLTLVLVTPSGDRMLERRLSRLNKPADRPDTVGTVLRKETGTFPFLRALVRGEWAERTQTQLSRAGLQLKVSEYLILRLVAGAGVAALTIIVASGSAIGLLIAIITGVAASFIPVLVVTVLKTRRQDLLAKQLPEALALISSSLRSGFAFTQAVELATKQLADPVKAELDLVLRDMWLGASAESALEELSQRTGSSDVELMVSSVLVQRTTGGNLSEILDNVAETVRERERLQSEIRAITSSQRLTGLVLSLYPLALWLILTGISPSIYKVLLTEAEGRVLLVIAAILQVFGILTIRRLLKLEV